MNKTIVEFIRDIYKTDKFIPLHAPTFDGNELAYVTETIKSTFVSSVGKFVDDFEKKIETFTRTPKAVATVNGTAALHAALYIAGIERGELVITQALTFVATCNVLYHMGAEPIFVDISKTSLGLCPKAVEAYLNENAIVDDRGCIHKQSQKRIRAVVPMHTFGHPVELDELSNVCQKWQLILVEDAAESLGSFYKGNHTGTIGQFGAISFNGNKVITTGGGGMVLCRNKQDGLRVKHVTTTAKVPHRYEFYHDEPGFNYRMPNINAAIGYAQMECLPTFLEKKRQLAMLYKAFFAGSDFLFFEEPKYGQSNYWLNLVICPNESSRNQLLQTTNDLGVMTRPIWKLMHRLPMFKNAYRDDLTISKWAESHVVNIPSSPILG